MKINWIAEEKTHLEFELQGEDHTFCNAIRRELWEGDDLNLAAYRIAHPLVSEPKLVVDTQKSDAKKALLAAIDSLRKKNKTLKESFQKALKQ